MSRAPTERRSGAGASRRADAAPRWLSDEEQAAWRGLQRMQARLNAALGGRLAAESDLSLQDYGVLVVLTERPDGSARPFEIGAEIGWEKSRLSHHLSRMQDRGLVTRSRCPTDQRGWLISITAAGRAAIEAAAPGHVAAVRELFVDRLSADQLATVAAVADAVLAAAPACPDE